MYWLQRPPYWRRAGAVALILGAIAWDLQAAETEPYPVAAHDLPAGVALDADDVVWVDIPAGTFAAPDLSSGVTTRPIASGEPLGSAGITSQPRPPDDWWTVPLDIGTTAVPGDQVLLVVADPPYTALGLVVAGQVGDRYALSYRPASVAVPPDDAALVAAAASDGLLVTAVRPRPASG